MTDGSPSHDVSRTLDRLREGNRRFVSGTGNRFAEEKARLRRDLTTGQRPDAAILACSDSRVPPTMIFDQGLGELFVVRVAGNVVTPEQLGSIEFAAATLGTRLVVVLGHTGCGAVAATLDELRRPSPALSPNLRAITERIRPTLEQVIAEVTGTQVTGPEAVKDLVAALDDGDRDRVLALAVRAHVAASIRTLRRDSDLLDRLARTEGLSVVGAEYRLETGAVDFFEAGGADARRAPASRV